MLAVDTSRPLPDGARPPGRDRSLLSIVVPVYNEVDNVARAHQAIVTTMSAYPDIDLELIFTDNHSTDGTFEKLKMLAATDRRVRVIRFARNFGFNRSILTGYRQARGAAAIQVDCDLEDPPSVFHEFIRRWREGHDVVVGVRRQRPERRLTALIGKAFYRLLAKISDHPVHIDAGDFRLVDRTILDQLQVIEDARPYLRGLISELACNPAVVPYDRHRREFGQSKFPLMQLINLAIDGIYAHSIVPLQLATYAGIVIAGLTALATVLYILASVTSTRAWPAGFTTTTVLILFGISLNALFLGIIGQYVGRIYQQLRVRPTVVVEQAVNIDLRGALYTGKDGDGLQHH